MNRSTSLALLGCILLSPQTVMAAVANFEDFPLAPNSYYEGADNAGGFDSGPAHFNNTYTDFGGGFTGYTGWAVSSMTDATTPGFGNQFSAYTGSGAGGSSNYGVLFATPGDDAFIDIPGTDHFQSIEFTNTTYAALSMLNGDSFAKKFGGASGNEPDYFGWTLTGIDALGKTTGTIDVYLADFRFADHSQDYIVDQWITVDLTSLGDAVRIQFEAFSSDNGPFGIDTPTYLAADNLVFVPETTSVLMVGTACLGLVVSRWRRK